MSWLNMRHHLTWSSLRDDSRLCHPGCKVPFCKILMVLIIWCIGTPSAGRLSCLRGVHRCLERPVAAERFDSSIVNVTPLGLRMSNFSNHETCTDSFHPRVMLGTWWYWLQHPLATADRPAPGLSITCCCPSSKSSCRLRFTTFKAVSQGKLGASFLGLPYLPSMALFTPRHNTPLVTPPILPCLPRKISHRSAAHTPVVMISSAPTFTGAAPHPQIKKAAAS